MEYTECSNMVPSFTLDCGEAMDHNRIEKIIIPIKCDNCGAPLETTKLAQGAVLDKIYKCSHCGTNHLIKF